MDKKIYLKTIEELNKDCIRSYNSKELQRYRLKKITYDYLKHGQFSKVFNIIIQSLENKRFRRKPPHPSHQISQTHQIRIRKIDIYTCITNNYDQVKEPLIKMENADYFVFSDNDNMFLNGIWQYKKIPKHIITICCQNPILINRYLKMHPQEVFAGYDYALYIDGNVQLISDVTEFFSYINNKTGLAMHYHRRRNDVYEEIKTLIRLKKGNIKAIKKWQDKLKKENFPQETGLLEATIIATDLQNSNAQKIMQAWYEDFVNSQTYRDQIVLPYTLHKLNFSYQDIGSMAINIAQNYKIRMHLHQQTSQNFNLLKSLKKKKESIAILGIGYVGLPLVEAFSKHYKVIAYDTNKEKVLAYQQKKDLTNEIGEKRLKKCHAYFTCNAQKLKESKVFIITVPTPVDDKNEPDLTLLEEACHTIAKVITQNSLVILESTVYPGVTEELCVPIIEKYSHLKHKKDFLIAYSPERINPGDKKHNLKNTVKLVAGSNEKATNLAFDIYKSIIKNVVKSPSIKVAEAAKVIENSQRDVNIAFINEMSIILHNLKIDTKEVLECAKTKWNFLNFEPGLVGGHCISVDPYYLITQSNQAGGYFPKLLYNARKINNYISEFIVLNIMKLTHENDLEISKLKVGILGFSFKENCPDVRNSQVFKIYQSLIAKKAKTLVYDPVVNAEEVQKLYNINLVTKQELKNLDVVIIAVAHQEFIELQTEEILQMYNKQKKIIIDVKGIKNKKELESKNIIYWRL